MEKEEDNDPNWCALNFRERRSPPVLVLALAPVPELKNNCLFGNIRKDSEKTFFTFFLKSNGREESCNRWKKHDVFQARADQLHNDEAEARQHESRVQAARRARADQYAIEMLRPISGVPSRKRSYENVGEISPSPPSAPSPLKRPRRQIDDTPFMNRLEMIKSRLVDKKPTRFKYKSWKEYRNESLEALQPYYPNTNLRLVVSWIEMNSKPVGSKPLSALRILTSLKVKFPNTEIATQEEMASLMKALGFKWGHLHSSYYVRISRRFDVICHRHECIPILHEFMTNRKYFYVNTDWSFEYENEISKYAWISLAQEESDLVESKPGKGKRFSFCEFISLSGILRHADGKSAGTILTWNQTLTSEDILKTMRRGLEAIANHPEVKDKGRVPVLHLDGARNQTTKDSDYIDPNVMNLSDGGANRVSMKGIGMKGLQRVLAENKQWVDGMRLKEARDRMWASRLVRDQLSQIEKLGQEFGVIIIYNPKAHPWLAFIEQLWRWIKDKLQNLLHMAEITKKYEELIAEFMDGKEWALAKCQKWFNLSLKYVEYYSRGGEDIVKDRDMRVLDLSTMGRLTRKPKFTTTEEARKETHNANFILFRGKQFQPVGAYW